MTDFLSELDLRWDGDEITEEQRRDLSELKHLYGSLDAHVYEQDVQHSAAVQVGDLGWKTLGTKACMTTSMLSPLTLNLRIIMSCIYLFDTLQSQFPSHLNTRPFAFIASQTFFPTKRPGYQKF